MDISTIVYNLFQKNLKYIFSDEQSNSVLSYFQKVTNKLLKIVIGPHIF